MNQIDHQQSLNPHEERKSLNEQLSYPVQKLRKIKEYEMKIIDMLGQSAKVQYSSFQFKFNTFKQMMTNFINTNQQLQQIIMEKFDQNLNLNLPKTEPPKDKKSNNQQKRNNKQQKTSEKQVQAKKNKTNCSSIEDNSKQPMRIQKKPKNELKQQKMIEQKPRLKTRGWKKKKMRTQQQVNIYQSQSEQQDDRRSTVNSVQELKRRTVLDYCPSNWNKNLKMEKKIEWVEGLIRERRFIPHLRRNFGELLLLPYGVLQRLMDYNESAEYGSGVAK